MGNIVIPGLKAKVVQTGVSRPFGTAGTIAIVGNFQKGDANTPYFYNNPSDALNGMGNSPSYSGSNIITYAFKQDLDQIRHIRNAFAHAKGEISFKTEEVANACQFHCADAFSDGIKFETARDQ